MRTVSELLMACGTDRAVLPPTALFNEGWLLRIILETLSQPELSGHLLAPAQDAQWFSEGLLPSPFPPGRRGDPLGEGWTHADAVVGHFTVPRDGGAEITLSPNAAQLVVAEAKLGSPLSSGTTRAPFYDQAARNVACIAQLIHLAKIPPVSLRSVAFVVLAPSKQLGRAVDLELLEKEHIRITVEKRVAMYSGEPDGAQKLSWLENAFFPLLNRLIVSPMSWETLIADVARLRPDSASSLDAFYRECLRFNPAAAA